MSTDQLLLQLVNKNWNLNKNDDSKCVALEAFDFVYHELLIDKLISKLYFKSSTSKLIGNYLENRSQRMRANNIISSIQSIPTGIPQRSIHGPLLLIAFINDLMELNNCYVFADDCLPLTYGAMQDEAKDGMECKVFMASHWYSLNRCHDHAIKQSKKSQYGYLTTYWIWMRMRKR